MNGTFVRSHRTLIIINTSVKWCHILTEARVSHWAHVVVVKARFYHSVGLVQAQVLALVRMHVVAHLHVGDAVVRIRIALIDVPTTFFVATRGCPNLIKYDFWRQNM